MATLTAEEGNDHVRYVDTRATSHMSHNIESFKTYKKLSNNQIVYLSNNITHQIFGQGKVFIKLENGQIWDIPNVLHVPSFKKNLIWMVVKLSSNNGNVPLKMFKVKQ